MIDPTLIQKSASEWVWRVPVDLTFPSQGRIGQVGEFEVEAQRDEVRYTEAMLGQLRDEAERLTNQHLPD